MIIRNQVMKTLEASPLNSRGSVIDEVASLVEERPTEYASVGNIDPEGVARRRSWGDPVGVDVTHIHLSGGTSYPRLLSGDASSVSCTSLRIINLWILSH